MIERLHLHNVMSGKTAETNLDEGVLNNDEWKNRWVVRNIGFHQSQHDGLLDAKEDEMFGGKTKSIFMPLCGKTFDIVWMYKKGHTVCGVEIAEQAIKEFFDENEIDFDVETVENIGKLYKSKDGLLRLYVADLFDMSRELCGQYDLIWDRRSLVAINLIDHEKYRDLVLSMMKDDGTYYLSTVEYDPAVWPGPPHTISDKVVKDIYGNYCTIELLEEKKRDQPKVSESQMEDGNPQPKPSSAGAALKTSTYVYDRWYKMTKK